MSFLRFIQYNNAVPVALVVVVLGAGSAFAAANPDAVFSVQESIIAIDNTYIANKDLSTYTPRAHIETVTEDEHAYYVAYTLDTIDIEESVWRDVSKREVMVVFKDSLGEYDDLGLFVTAQLKQIVDRELARLKETQEIERKHVTQKTVATAYGGLIGALLDSTTEEIPGYTPVVVRPVPVATEQDSGSAQSGVGDSTQVPLQQTANPGNTQDNIAGLQVLGNNPAHVDIGTVYIDLGVAITNVSYMNFGVHVQVDGVESEQVLIDTSVLGTHTVRYTLTNDAGVVSVVERQILVGDTITQLPSQDVTTTPETSTTTPETATATSSEPIDMPAVQ